MKKLYLVIVSMFLISQVTVAGDYPKSADERKAEEIGSVLGGEGVVFHPGKVKNLATKTDNSKINQFLWQATLDVVDFAPIISSESEQGFISTDWYSDKKDAKRSFKLQVSIVGDIISPESIKTTLKQRIKKDGVWIEDDAPSSIQMDVEDKILRRARQLYIRKSSK